MSKIKKKKAPTLNPQTLAAIKDAYKKANTHMEQGNHAGAAPIFNKILELNPAHYGASYGLGRILLLENKPKDALPHLELALANITDQPELYEVTGIAAFRAGDYASAQKYLNKGLKLKPKMPLSLDALGALHYELRKYEDAEQYFRQAIEVDPQCLQPYFNLAKMMEQQTRLEDAEDILAQGLAIDPADPKLNVVKALLLKRQKKYAEAIEVLEAHPPGNIPIASVYYAELGQLYDRTDNSAQAFRAFAKANRIQKGPVSIAQKNPYRALVASYKAMTEETDPAIWQASPPQNAAPAPVFLIGFPRSGTTLLDQILTAQGSFAVAEEVKTMTDIRHKIDGNHKDYPACIPALDEAEIASLRDAYTKDLIKQGGLDADKTPVDKMPLNTVHIALIHRLFPDAKIIFALRHPCDSVLSCFMQQFELNTAMANFLDINDAAAFYDETMALWKLYQEKMPLNVHVVCYEKVVADFRNEIASLLTFLDVPWNDAVLDFDKTAKERTSINTPSYSQVTEKIYSRASGRWTRYEEQLEPVLPTLLPWATYFGYK